MIKGLTILSVIMLVIFGSTHRAAHAADCSSEIKKVDAALAGASLRPQQLKTVKTLRDMGSRLNAAGREADCLKTLTHTKQLLKQLGVTVR